MKQTAMRGSRPQSVADCNGSGRDAAAWSKRVSNFDSIRGVGIILVVLYHMDYRIANHAWLCISAFFTLSGLMITGVTIQALERKGHVDVLGFSRNRVARLFPGLFLLLVLCAVGRFWRHEDEAEFRREGMDLLWAIPFLTNYNLCVAVHCACRTCSGPPPL